VGSQIIRLPKTGAQAVVSLAYRGKAELVSLRRVGDALTRPSPKRATSIEVALTDEQLFVLEQASRGRRAAGIVSVARILDRALRSLPEKPRQARGPRKAPPHAGAPSKRKRKCVSCKRAQELDQFIGNNGVTCLTCRASGASRVPIAREISGGSPGLGQRR
jgi:hypothetical protein